GVGLENPVGRGVESGIEGIGRTAANVKSRIGGMGYEADTRNEEAFAEAALDDYIDSQSVMPKFLAGWVRQAADMAVQSYAGGVGGGALVKGAGLVARNAPKSQAGLRAMMGLYGAQTADRTYTEGKHLPEPQRIAY